MKKEFRERKKENKDENEWMNGNGIKIWWWKNKGKVTPPFPAPSRLLSGLFPLSTQVLTKTISYLKIKY